MIHSHVCSDVHVHLLFAVYYGQHYLGLRNITKSNGEQVFLHFHGIVLFVLFPVFKCHIECMAGNLQKALSLTITSQIDKDLVILTQLSYHGGGLLN